MSKNVVIDGVTYVPISGRRNAGNFNAGNFNTGGCNTGDYNTGGYNAGDYNAGNFNTGGCNTGSYNAGDFNTGGYNAGNCNTGDYNTGGRNAGNFNTGSYNAGDYNAGNCNTGDYNTGGRNAGFFCTGVPAPMFFDRPTILTWDEAVLAVPYVALPEICQWVSEAKMSVEEKQANPNSAVLGGYLKVDKNGFKEAFRHAWETTISEADKKRFLALPNFDAEKFYAITGVDVRSVPADDVVVVGGRRYRRIDD